MDLKTIKSEEGKLKKIIGAIKKMLSKELLWALFVILMSIPIALILSYIISTDAHISQEIDEVTEIIAKKYPTFTVIYGICVVGIYFSRIVAEAVRIQLKNKK